MSPTTMYLKTGPFFEFTVAPSIIRSFVRSFVQESDSSSTFTWLKGHQGDVHHTLADQRRQDRIDGRVHVQKAKKRVFRCWQAWNFSTTREEPV
jgi:hypothetical protein